MKSIVIGIGGGTGAGKTTLCQKIIEAFSEKDVAIIHQDSYYKDHAHLSEEERSKINYDHPLAFETDLLVNHMEQLKNLLPIEMPLYDYAHHCRKEETQTIHPVPVIVVEGLLVLDDKRLRELMDIKIFVDTDADIRLIRRIRRDIRERGRSIDSVIEQYLSTVRPMHLEFVERSKRYADIIMPGGINAPALDMIISRIRDFLSLRKESLGE
ncbi:MAG: uridine kinase [Planctomycetota bacterium]|nr:MAG: uridine kinase [Planctomycetota bacterium]